MKKSISILIVVTVLLFASSAMAHEKIVVIPLNVKDTCADPNLLPENICMGITIFGVTGTGGGCIFTVQTETGRVWMDRNLGASRVATSSTDTLAQGDLYQWGRLMDGHEKRGSSTVNAQSGGDNPGHSDFITGFNDWRSSSNNTLWQGVAGTNNPCPSGFRIPTIAEWAAEAALWAPNTSLGAYTSPLKLTTTGHRTEAGVEVPSSSFGYYWSSDVAIFPQGADILVISTGSITENDGWRSRGHTVRCIQNY